jgi:hypothetical protein
MGPKGTKDVHDRID